MTRPGAKETGATADLDRVVVEVVIVVGFGVPWAARVSLHRPKAVAVRERAVMRVPRVRIVRQVQVTSAVGRVERVLRDRRVPAAVSIVAEVRVVGSGATIVAVRVLVVKETRGAGRRTVVPISARTSMLRSTPRMRVSLRWRRPSEAHAGRSSCSTLPRR